MKILAFELFEFGEPCTQVGDTALERGGHFDSVWGYRTDEGLGLLEYFQFAEDLGSEPVWVVNAGISAMQDIPPEAGMGRPGVAVVAADVLDGLEYLTGSSENTTWGALRAKHGRVLPFQVSSSKSSADGAQKAERSANSVLSALLQALMQRWPFCFHPNPTLTLPCPALTLTR